MAVAAMAVTGNVRLAADDDTVFLSVVAFDEEGQEEGDEEEDAVPKAAVSHDSSQHVPVRAYMIPKAKLALSMAQPLLVVKWKKLLLETVKPSALNCPE